MARKKDPKEPHQAYRLRLVDYWVDQCIWLFDKYDPTVLISEIMPPTGGSIAGIINRQLGLTVITTIQAMATYHGKSLKQIGATTVKKYIGGHAKASKVKIRDGVLTLLPELEARRSEWTGKNAVWDEVDALAIGLSYLI